MGVLGFFRGGWRAEVRTPLGALLRRLCLFILVFLGLWGFSQGVTAHGGVGEAEWSSGWQLSPSSEVRCKLGAGRLFDYFSLKAEMKAEMMKMGRNSPEAAGSYGASVGPVYIFPVTGEVSQAQFVFLRRAIKLAEAAGARAIVLEMDTPGGEVGAAIEEMGLLAKTKVPTLTYVNTKALSAGALVALATQRIYMAPNAVIGAAAPVLGDGTELPETLREKTVSALSAMARAAAQRTGRSPDLAGAFIDRRKEFRVGGVLLDGPDSLLNLSAEEAAALYDGKPLLAEGVAGSIAEMLEAAGLSGGRILRVEPTGVERLAFYITTFAPLLLFLALLCAYLEAKMAGFGLFGFLSILFFGLFFAGHHLAGLAGWEAAGLFAVGCILMAVELWLHPGTFVTGVLGFLMILGSLLFAMMDWWPGHLGWTSEEVWTLPLLKLISAIAAVVVVAVWLLKDLSCGGGLYRWMVLADAVPTVVKEEELQGLDIFPRAGARGRARTSLRPSGKAIFGERLVDVVSRGDFVSEGTPVRITRVEGSRVEVEEVAQSERTEHS
jgi:membrane-bound serine protease (ClpP class)